MSANGLDALFQRYANTDGILREEGLTSMLLSAGLDTELSNLLIKRAQWLSEHYGTVCITREDFDVLLGDFPKPDQSQRRIDEEYVHFDKVRLNLGGVPSQSVALLNAARLGLELENDIRVSAERLNHLRHPQVPVRFQPPPIHETIPLTEATGKPTSYDASRAQPGESNVDSSIALLGMPLL